ncbi:hypothetical protein V6U90_32575, partial [Micromonospora sp. CPCC 206060]|uniref:hypothetical protein n=1 Tax=Micromonospora sp. CPCC 206060 TaxID=3122406 RepID=UPI002FF17972
TRTARDSILDQFKSYLLQRYADNVTDTDQLLAEIRERGNTVSRGRMTGNAPQRRRHHRSRSLDLELDDRRSTSSSPCWRG